MIKNSSGWLQTLQAFAERLVIMLVEMPKVVADKWPLDVVLKDLCNVSRPFSFRLYCTTTCARLELIPFVAVTIKCLIISIYIKYG